MQNLYGILDDGKLWHQVSTVSTIKIRHSCSERAYILCKKRKENEPWKSSFRLYFRFYFSAFSLKDTLPNSLAQHIFQNQPSRLQSRVAFWAYSLADRPIRHFSDSSQCHGAFVKFLSHLVFMKMNCIFGNFKGNEAWARGMHRGRGGTECFCQCQVLMGVFDFYWEWCSFIAYRCK